MALSDDIIKSYQLNQIFSDIVRGDPPFSESRYNKEQHFDLIDSVSR
jgi:hypothetical protein